jgi:hypothetical protein
MALRAVYSERVYAFNSLILAKLLYSAENWRALEMPDRFDLISPSRSVVGW